jgi:hypothetical protein
MFVAFYLFDCVCFTLGNIVSDPFSEDFQDQAFEESSFSLRISKASYLEHIAPIVIFLYLFYRIRTA